MIHNTNYTQKLQELIDSGQYSKQYVNRALKQFRNIAKNVKEIGGKPLTSTYATYANLTKGMYNEYAMIGDEISFKEYTLDYKMKNLIDEYATPNNGAYNPKIEKIVNDYKKDKIEYKEFIRKLKSELNKDLTYKFRKKFYYDKR